MAGIGGGQSSSSSMNMSQQHGTASNTDQLPYFQNLWQGAQNYMGGRANTFANQAQDWIAGAQGVLQGQFNPQQVADQMKYYGQQIGQNFRENILPALQGQAIQAGGLGSSRNQLAQGYAGAQANQQLHNMGNQLYESNQNRALQAAGMVPGMANAFGQMGWSPYTNMAGILGQLQMKNLGGSSYGTSSSDSWNANVAVGGGG